MCRHKQETGVAIAPVPHRGWVVSPQQESDRIRSDLELKHHRVDDWAQKCKYICYQFTTVYLCSFHSVCAPSCPFRLVSSVAALSLLHFYPARVEHSSLGLSVHLVHTDLNEIYVLLSNLHPIQTAPPLLFYSSLHIPSWPALFYATVRSD